MEKQNISPRKALSVLLAIIMTLSIMLPVGSALAASQDNVLNGAVEVITNPGLVINDDDASNVTVKNEETVTLEWYPKDTSVGRWQDGWWIGVKVIAPSGLTAEDLKNVKYKSQVNGAEKSFWANKDSADDASVHYITCWLPVTEETLKAFTAAKYDLTWVYTFDWDRNGFEETTQKIVISIDPSKVVLKKGDETVYDETYFNGAVEVITNPGLVINDDDASNVTVRNENTVTLEWYPKDTSVGRWQDGWWIGVKVIAPSGLTADDLKNVKYKSQVNGAEKSFWANKDSSDDASVHYITCWLPVTEETLKAFIAAKYDLTWVYTFDWDRNGFEETTQKIVITIDPTKVDLHKNGAHYHVYDNTTVDPTCTAGGYDSHLCIVCGYEYRENFTDPTSHQPSDEWITVREATCKESGIEKNVCKVCGETLEYRETNTVPHDYEATVVEPTCVSGGYTVYVCKVCGNGYIGDSVSADGHQPSDEWITVREATCSSCGIEKNVCAVCGETIEYRETQILAHDYELTVVEATCVSGGYTTHTCKVCGSSYVGELTVAKGHQPSDEWITVRESACNAYGIDKKVCTVCGVTVEYRENEMLAHEYETTVIAPTCLNGGYTIHTCKNCSSSYVGELTSANGHSYKEYTTKATPTANGKIEKKCEVCGNVASKTTIYKASKVSLSKTEFVYTGKVQKPTVTVKDSKGKVISPEYYTIKYSSGCKETGTYTVKVTFSGIYSGSVKLTFKITFKEPTISVTSPSKNTAKVTWNKVTGATSYTVYYSTKKSSGYKKLATVTGTSYTSKKLTSGKTYYFKVVANKKTGTTLVTSNYSAVKSVKVK